MKQQNPYFISVWNRKGVVILVLLCLVIAFIPRILMSFQVKDLVKIDQKQIELLKLRQEKLDSGRKSYSKKDFKNRYKTPPLRFNPNDYSLKEWMNIGLSEKQAIVVLKFTKRGIYSNDQLKKIFVIPDELYELIKDSTFFPQKANFSNEKSSVYKDTKIALVDVNSADQNELEGLKGIGSFYAKNILNYRNKLGGFANKEQLLEVWKMTPEVYDLLQDKILLKTSGIIKLNINSVTVEELKNHPYISWNCANSIVKLRLQKTKFSSIEEIKESKIIDEELFLKLKPYIFAE